MTVVEGVIAKEELGFCLWLNDDKHTTIDHEVYLGM